MIYWGIIPSSIRPSLIVALHLIFKNWSVQTLAGAHLSQKLYLYEQRCFYVLGCNLFLKYTFKNKRYSYTYLYPFQENYNSSVQS